MVFCFLFQQLIKPDFNIQSTKHIASAFVSETRTSTCCKEHGNQILVYATMLPFNLSHFTGLVLYSQKTSENLIVWSRQVIREQWHEMNAVDDVLFTRETSFDA